MSRVQQEQVSILGPDRAPVVPEAIRRGMAEKVEQVRTMRVRIKANPKHKPVIINETDFDADRHEVIEKLDMGELERDPVAPGADGGPTFSDYDRAELAVMPVEKLKELPEWNAVPDNQKKKCTTKEQVVQAILGARNPG